MMVFLGNARSMAMSSAKMRVPSIKFRYGHNRLAGSQTPTHGATVAPQQQGAQTGHGTVAENESQLPRRFQRQAISDEEIEYINRGGPA